MVKLGMDLGTSTSEISYIKNGEAYLIKNTQEGDSNILPSIVLYENEEFRVGNIAKKKLLLKPELTVKNIKNLMGEDTKIKLDNKEFTPEYISGVIAKRLKEIAEFNLNEKVTEVIVAVPANFTSNQRKATRDALKIAGFNKIDIINEPTAAAIAYGFDNLENNKVLVYDLGGGTFDVSLLEVKNRKINVLASKGKGNCGGVNINNILFEAIISLFESSLGTSIDKENKRLLTQIDEVIEEAKKDLSFQTEANIVIPNIAIDESGNYLDLNLDLSRDDFEYLVEDFVDSTMDVMVSLLTEKNLKIEDIDKVILVGGSTRIPLINRKINEKFKGKIVKGINPEELVAKGCILSSRLDETKNLVTEISNNNIGIEILGGKTDFILQKGEILPVYKKKKYKTIEDNQEIAEIRVLEGQSKIAKENNKISTLELDGIPKSKKGNEFIELNLTCNIDGTLDLVANVISNNNKLSSNISRSGLSNESIEVLKDKLKNTKVFSNTDIIKENEEIVKLREIEEKNKKENERRIEEEKIRQEEIAKIKKEKEMVKALEEKRKEEKRKEEKRKEEKRKEEKRKEEKRKEEKRKEEERIRKEKIIREEKIREEEESKLAILEANALAKEIVEVKKEVPKVEHKLVFNNESSIKAVVDKEEKHVEAVIDSQVVDKNEFIEEYDPSRDSEIYADIATLMEYYKRVRENLDEETIKEANDLISDMAAYVKQDEFRKARELENKIISLIYIG
ncbi:MAG: Hsp70 family protein [Sarcina sp.]